VSSQQDDQDPSTIKLFLEQGQPHGGNPSTETFVGNDLAAIFPANKMKRQIGDQQAGIYGKQGREGFYHQRSDQESTKNKCGVLRNREANSSQDEEDKQP
jgi:hypothetical protein